LLKPEKGKLKPTFDELNRGIIEIQDRIFNATPSTPDQRIRYTHELDQYLTENSWTLVEYYKAVEEFRSDEQMMKDTAEFLDMMRKEMLDDQSPVIF